MRVWYVGYGSNLSAERFRHYVEGGQPAGAARVYLGCRDRTPPARDEPVTLPGGVYFALRSRVWGGGMAFYDQHLPGPAPARAYLVTADQFADIAAQEAGRDPGGPDLDLTTVLRTGRDQVGAGRYETLLHLGDRDGYPMLTVTAPWSAGTVEHTAPAPAYLRLVARGLAHSHRWDAARVGAYLAGRPGAAGHWTAGQIAALVPGP